MERIKRKTLNILFVIGLFVAFQSCAEKSPSGGSGVNPSSTPGVVSSDPLCEALGGNSQVMQSVVAPYVTSLCNQGLLTTLRTQYVYTGTGTPPLDETVTEPSTSSSHITLWTSLVTPATPEAYFGMVELEAMNPTQFQAQGYQYDTSPNLKYTILSQTATSVDYHYYNQKYQDSADTNLVTVSYSAISNFITITANQVYAVINMLDSSHPQTGDNVSALSGLLIINQNTAKNNETEVFSMSDQIFGNDNNPGPAEAEAESSFQNEMVRAYNNSLKLH